MARSAASYIYPHNDPNFPDKILIGGSFNASSGSIVITHNFARLNADGSLDTTFPQTFIVGGSGELRRGAGLRDHRQDPGGRL